MLVEQFSSSLRAKLTVDSHGVIMRMANWTWHWRNCGGWPAVEHIHCPIVNCATSHCAASIDGVAINCIDQFGVTMVSYKQVNNGPMSLWQLPTTRSPQLRNNITTPFDIRYFLGYDSIPCIQVCFISSSYCNLFSAGKLSKKNY